MFGLTKMHELAAARGDGLKPELLDLFEQRQRTIAANVARLHGRFDQAGPNPALAESELPEGVVPFRRRTLHAG
ncbi:MAG TPA: hypothetical protein VMF90_00205 [Rhizobiaceae bacterium]|nr:hypothetical protein [Rhizobiaceae bacterium]